MANFNIIFKDSAEKDLRKISKQYIKNIVSKIQVLTDNPFPHGYTKLSGREEFYRIRSGDYRIIYTVDLKAKAILICYIRHRKDVYKVI